MLFRSGAALKNWVAKAHGLAVSQVKGEKKAKKPKAAADKARSRLKTVAVKKKAVGKTIKTAAARKQTKK